MARQEISNAIRRPRELARVSGSCARARRDTRETSPHTAQRVETQQDVREDEKDARADEETALRSRATHPHCRRLQQLHFPIPLNGTPFFITPRTFRNALMSLVGSPSTSTRSANKPGLIEPMRSSMCRIRALPDVAAIKTCDGVMP